MTNRVLAVALTAVVVLTLGCSGGGPDNTASVQSGGETGGTAGGSAECPAGHTLCDGSGSGGTDTGATGGTTGETGGSAGDETGGVASVGGQAGQGGSVDDEARARLESIQARAIELQNDIISFWKQYGPDNLHGGFNGTIDRTGNAVDPTDKFVHQQARHLWAFSAWYRQKESTTEVRTIAEDLASFLDNFRDSASGQYSYCVSRDGGTVVDDMKLLYAQSFVILGLSEYALAFDDQGARDAALGVFQFLDAAMHDTTYRGYDQTSDPWWWNVDGATKSTNVHMHLLESFTNLYRATSNATVAARVNELVDVFMDDIAQPEDYFHTEFALDWTPLANPAVVEYGHDLQTYWLMLDTLDATGRANDQPILDQLIAIAENSSLRGYDPNGGYHFSGPPGGQAEAADKEWWVQAESMNGLLRLYFVTGDSVHLDRLETTLDYVETYQADTQYGEWYAVTRSDGSPGDETNKGYEWKTSYHTLRAALQLDQWVSQYLQ